MLKKLMRKPVSVARKVTKKVLGIQDTTHVVTHVQQIIDRAAHEETLLALGTLLTKQQLSITATSIRDYEFKIFSQWGEDGIIQHLVRNLAIPNQFFVEFGVENFNESNTRFLMMQNNWSGFVMDGSKEHMEYLRNQPWFWKYDLTCKDVFIDKDNIDRILKEHTPRDIGLLSIDIDGNDLYVLESIDFSYSNPAILVVEYNAVFGKERAITVPYDPTFNRTEKHYSNLYFGASLPAIKKVAEEKGYAFVGCNTGACNAFFVRKDLLNDRIQEVSIEEGFQASKFRQSRDEAYHLSYLSGAEELAVMKGLPVINILTGKEETL